MIAALGLAPEDAQARLATSAPDDPRLVRLRDEAGQCIGLLGIVSARPPGRTARARLADLAALAVPLLCEEAAGTLADSRGAEERLRDFLATSTDWVWETDTAHRFTHFRDEGGVSGLDYADVIGRARWELGGEDKAAEPFWAKHKADLDAHRPIRDFVYSRKRNDGGWLVSEVNGNPVYDASGRFLGYRGTARDIGARHEAQEKLKRLTLVARLTKNIIVLCDAEGAIEWVNPACEDLSGRRLDELVGRPPSAAIPALAADDSGAREARRALAEAVCTRVRLETDTGRRRALDLEVQPICECGGGIGGFILVGNDITEEINGRTRLQALIDNVPAGIALRDVTGRIVSCNRESERLLGLP